jgi:uncharacterized protein YydD (DUF2326 family)
MASPGKVCEELLQFDKNLIKILSDDNEDLKTKVKLLEQIVKSKIRILRKENEMLKTRVQFLTNLIEYNEAIVKRYLHF